MKKYVAVALMSMMIVSGASAMQDQADLFLKKVAVFPLPCKRFMADTAPKATWLIVQALIAKGCLAYLTYKGIRWAFSSKNVTDKQSGINVS